MFKCFFYNLEFLLLEILSKNLVTLKRWDGVKDHGGSLKNPIFKGEVTKNQYIVGNCLKRGGLDSLQI